MFLSFSRRPPLSCRPISDPSPPARRAAVADGRRRAGPLPGNARMRRGVKPGGATAVAAITVLTRAAPVGMGGDEPLLLRQRRLQWGWLETRMEDQGVFNTIREAVNLHLLACQHGNTKEYIHGQFSRNLGEI
ncbi:uncharacterized protein [Miscanthus floridulus]|uniref:uncharacterized protein n=1 Tax=Miscanthus floridulus TaxID=154761 RepID=UPI003459A45C